MKNSKTGRIWKDAIVRNAGFTQQWKGGIIHKIYKLLTANKILFVGNLKRGKWEFAYFNNET